MPRNARFLASTTARALVFFLVVGAAAATLRFEPAGAQAVNPAVHEINGRVLSFDERALPGASLVLSKADSGASVATASTDAEGTYKFSQVEAGEFKVTGSHSCCLSNSVRVTVEALSVQTSAPDLVLDQNNPPVTRDPVRLQGVAFDTGSNAKLAEVSIEIDNYYDVNGTNECPPNAACTMVMPGNWQHFSVVSGADGSYQVDVNKGRVQIYASRQGYDFARTSFWTSDNLTMDVPMRPTDASTAKLHGVVRGDDGKLIAGASVNVQPYYGDDYGRCDPCAVPLEGDSSSDGWHYESANSGYNSTTTQADGSWEMFTTAGDRQVQAYANEYLPASVHVTLQKGDSHRVDFVLEKIPADSVRVYGRVLEAKTDQPLAYASINLENQKWGHYNYTQSDASGQFEFYTKPGYTIVTARAMRYDRGPCPASAEADRAGPAPAKAYAPTPACGADREADYYSRSFAFVGAANSGKEFEFELQRRPDPTSEFKGYVVNASSKAGVPNAYVTFFNERTNDWGSASTDQDGSYRIKVHAGYYTVRVGAEHFFDGVDNVEVDEKESKRLDLTLEPGEKRYGYYGPYYYGGGGYATLVAHQHGAYSEDSARAGPGGPWSVPATAAPTPTEGEQVYKGEGGGLGPYRPQSVDGRKSPGLPMLLAGLATLGALSFARRGRRAA